MRDKNVYNPLLHTIWIELIPSRPGPDLRYAQREHSRQVCAWDDVEPLVERAVAPPQIDEHGGRVRDFAEEVSGPPGAQSQWSGSIRKRPRRDDCFGCAPPGRRQRSREAPQSSPHQVHGSEIASMKTAGAAAAQKTKLQRSRPQSAKTRTTSPHAIETLWADRVGEVTCPPSAEKLPKSRAQVRMTAQRPTARRWASHAVSAPPRPRR